ncbi:MAG: sarcosine oxidase subunit gamma family protein [Pseudomonadota bacterium]
MAEPDSSVELHRLLPSGSGMARPGLALRFERELGIGKIQIFGTAPDARFRRIAGAAAPHACGQTEQGGLTIAWLAPGEWLLTGPEPQVIARLEQIDEHEDDEVLAIDLTHARSSFLISGTDARDTLAAHCPLDLWSGTFPVHAVARSLLGDASMFIARLTDVADGPQFRIIIDQTMEDHVARMLAGPQLHSGTPK